MSFLNSGYYDLNIDSLNVVIRSSIKKINESKHSKSGARLVRNLMIAQIARKARQFTLIHGQQQSCPTPDEEVLPCPDKVDDQSPGYGVDTSMQTDHSQMDIQIIEQTNSLPSVRNELLSTKEVCLMDKDISHSEPSNDMLVNKSSSDKSSVSHDIKSSIRAQVVCNIFKRCFSQTLSQEDVSPSSDSSLSQPEKKKRKLSKASEPQFLAIPSAQTSDGYTFVLIPYNSLTCVPNSVQPDRTLHIDLKHLSAPLLPLIPAST